MSTPVHQAIAALPVPGEWTWQVVVRPRRRTLGIEIDEGGDVLFAVPPDADPAAVAQAVRTRLPRLAREVRRRRTRPGEPVTELIGGTSFTYLGRRHRLKLLPQDEGSRVRLYRGWLELPRPQTAGEGAHRIAQWYEGCGTRWLAARLPTYASRVGLPTPPVEACDLGPRWGLWSRTAASQCTGRFCNCRRRWWTWFSYTNSVTCVRPVTVRPSGGRYGSCCRMPTHAKSCSRGWSRDCGAERSGRDGIAATRPRQSLKHGLPKTLGLDEPVEILARHRGERLRTAAILAADRLSFFTLYFDATGTELLACSGVKRSPMPSTKDSFEP